MQQSSVWETNSSSAGQENPRISWNSKFCYCFHKNTSPVPILCQLNPVDVLPCSFLKIRLNVFLIISEQIISITYFVSANDHSDVEDISLLLLPPDFLPGVHKSPDLSQSWNQYSILTPSLLSISILRSHKSINRPNDFFRLGFSILMYLLSLLRMLHFRASQIPLFNHSNNIR